MYKYKYICVLWQYLTPLTTRDFRPPAMLWFRKSAKGISMVLSRVPSKAKPRVFTTLSAQRKSCVDQKKPQRQAIHIGGVYKNIGMQHMVYIKFACMTYIILIASIQCILVHVYHIPVY